MNNSKQILALGRLYHKQLLSRSVATNDVTGPKIRKLKAIQEKMQIDDGLPVHLKAGFRDKMLYQGTVLLVLIGLGMTIDVFYKLTKK